jgi:quinol monooxygenase YgiN
MTTFFERCDTDKSKNIDHGELISFFSAGAVGTTYAPIFATLERIHSELNAALIASHAANSSAPQPEQLFKERFFLREIASQLETLQRTADIGLRGVSALSPVAPDAAERDRFEIASVPVDTPASAAQNAEIVVPLQKQVDRLHKLISRLDKGHARFNVPEEEIGVSTDAEAFLIVARHYAGVNAVDGAHAARTYVAAARRQPSCRHVSVRVVRGEAPDAGELFIHEIWEEGDDFQEYEQAADTKALAAALGAKSKSTKVEKMHLPASWFVYQ